MICCVGFKSLKLFCLASLGIGLMVACQPKVEDYANLEYESQGALAFFKKQGEARGFTGIARQHDKQGQLTAEFPLKDGYFHGEVREWYAGGQKKSSTYFQRGERHGLNQEWNSDGSLYREREYDRDKIVREVNP